MDMRPSLSRGQCHFYKLYDPPFQEQAKASKKMALIGKVVSEKKFENNGHIHVYSPGTGEYMWSFLVNWWRQLNNMVWSHDLDGRHVHIIKS